MVSSKQSSILKMSQSKAKFNTKDGVSSKQNSLLMMESVRRKSSVLKMESVQSKVHTEESVVSDPKQSSVLKAYSVGDQEQY